MKLHLIDQINKRDELFELGGNVLINRMLHKIDDVIDKYNYSCLGYFVDKIDRENKVVTLRWRELFGSDSIPYIRIEECTERIIEYFERKNGVLC